MEEAKKIFEFEVLYSGWEGDNEGWVMENPDGTRWIKMTSHGTEYEADPMELTLKAEEYMYAIKNTRKALELLDANNS